MDSLPHIPFRWDVRRIEALGGLVEGESAKVYPGFWNELTRAAADVIVEADGRDIYFVGRSPELLFEFLRGALERTSWRGRVHLLQLSLRGWHPDRILGELPAHMAALRGYLVALGLHPRALATRRPVVLADVVDRGETFGNIVSLLYTWSAETCVSWRGVQSRLGFVGLLARRLGRGPR